MLPDDEFPPFEKYTRQFSFILRCWRNSKGELRLRLIDVQTGQGYYVEKHNQLVELISSLSGSGQDKESIP
jgi:hypothetical protein